MKRSLLALFLSAGLAFSVTACEEGEVDGGELEQEVEGEVGEEEGGD